MSVQCLLFDVGGSVFDWQSAIVAAQQNVENVDVRNLNALSFSSSWREQSLVEMYEIAREEKPWRPFASFMNTSLDTVLARCEIADISESDRHRLNLAWCQMPVWPEVPDGLRKLRNHFLIAPHTILGLGPVSRSSKSAGISWDAILSCDGLGVTKTNPRSYQLAAQTFGFELHEICYVAAHASDLWVAQKLGMKTAYVESRLYEYGEDPDGTDYTGKFDFIAADYADLANKMTAIS